MFKHFNAAIQKQFAKMSTTRLFTVALDKDKLWETYLQSFPEGSNPIYKVRAEHDCSCCRQFVRAVGNVASIGDGRFDTIWNVDVEEPYKTVATAMKNFVADAFLAANARFENVFLHESRTVGAALTRQLLEDKSVKTWDHFCVTLPQHAFDAKGKIAERLGAYRATFDVLLRSLETISFDAIETVLDLIAQNSLYRGDENKFAVQSFAQLKATYDATAPVKRDAYVWSKVGELPPAPESVLRIRNTAIGTLLVDLSEGKEIEDAVKAFESKVAPTNYKRPTAVVTKAMIKKAQAEVEALGLLPSLERRYAVVEDITVNNVLFADRSARRAMNAFESLADETLATAKKMDAVEEIGIDDFVANVIPTTKTLELFVENKHAGNFVSLVAPADATAKPLFKWDNGFSWSYAGDLTDSIKERVKKAGGSVTGDLRCSLSWYNYDDLDLHMQEPSSPASRSLGDHIYYAHRRSGAYGELDVDMNAGSGTTRSAVENITYPDERQMPKGVYHLYVHNFCKRESADVGFEAEIEYKGVIHSFSYAKAVPNEARVTVAKFELSPSGIVFHESLESTAKSKVVWGVPTQTFRKVSVALLSPNHWNGHPVGSKHYFFMLEGCANEGKARGFYNEFLREDLSAHRKVLELVGAKMRTEEASRQLSGLGFSSTRRDGVLVRVTGSFTRTLKVNF